MVRGAAGLTLAAGAVLHQLHVIDCVGRLGKKKKQEEAFKERAAAACRCRESLWERDGLPEEVPADGTEKDRLFSSH